MKIWVAHHLLRLAGWLLGPVRATEADLPPTDGQVAEVLLRARATAEPTVPVAKFALIAVLLALQSARAELAKASR